MIMLDTNILIDLRERDPAWYAWSLRRLAEARVVAAPAISAIVVGELAVTGASIDALLELVRSYGLAVEPLGAEAAHRAGVAQRAYRAAGGGRERLLADFLIGAHAASRNATLVTRDARRYRRYFPELTLITPENDNG